MPNFFDQFDTAATAETEDTLGNFFDQFDAPPPPRPSPTPTTFYSLGTDVGGPDETNDKWTNRGYSATGQNLTPGIAAVNPNKYPIGTVLRDEETGFTFLAADKHGNRDPNVIDLYVDPADYQRRKETRNFSVIGRVPENQIPRTAEGVRALLANYGEVPAPNVPADVIPLEGELPEEADTEEEAEPIVAAPPPAPPPAGNFFDQFDPHPLASGPGAGTAPPSAAAPAAPPPPATPAVTPTSAAPPSPAGNFFDQFDEPAAMSLQEKTQSLWENVRNQFARGATSDGGILSSAQGAYGMVAQGVTPGTVAADIFAPSAQQEQATAKMRAAVQEALPVDNAFAGSIVGGVVQGLGQLAGTLPFYVVPGAGPAISITGLYQEAKDDYVQEQTQKGLPVDPKQAHRAAIKYLAGAAPADIILDKMIVGKALKKLVGKATVGQLAKTFGKLAASGGISEGWQQAWLNGVAKWLEGYDKDRLWDEDVWRSAAVGGLVSAGGGTALEAAARGVERTPAPAKAAAALANVRVQPEEISEAARAETFGAPPETGTPAAEFAPPGTETTAATPEPAAPAPQPAKPAVDTKLVDATQGVATTLQQEMPRGPTITVVSSLEAATVGLNTADIADLRVAGAEAFYDDSGSGRVVLVVENFAPRQGETLPSYVRRIVNHEAAGHGGLARLFEGPMSKQYGQIFAALYNKLAPQNFGDAWRAKHGYSTLQELAQWYGYDWSDPEGVYRTIEEHLARLAEEPQVPRWYDEVISRITYIMREGFGMKTWTNADTRILLARARDQLGIDARRTAESASTAAYSRGIDAISFSKPARPVRFVRSLDVLTELARNEEAFKDWYADYARELERMLGEHREYAPLITEILAALSPQNEVVANVTRAIDVLESYVRTGELPGMMEGHRQNVERALRGEKLSGPKVGPFAEAMHGDVEAMAIDRHVAMLLFNTKTPSLSQIRAAKKRIRQIAARLGWTPSQAQAAIWAANIRRLGNPIESYEKAIESQIERFHSILAADRAGEGRGLQAVRRIAERIGARGSTAPGDLGYARGTAGALRFSIPLDEIAGAHNAYGGSTINAVHGDLAGTNSYALSIFPDLSTKIPGSNVTPAQLRAYAQRVQALGIDIESPNISIGTWYDQEADTTFLDVSFTTTDRARAVELARAFNQKAIFDLNALEEIATGGTGEVQAGLSSLDDRLGILFPNLPTTHETAQATSGRANAQAAQTLPRGAQGGRPEVGGLQEKVQELRFSKPVTPAEKRRGFVESVKAAESVLPEVKDRVEGIYSPLTNAATVAAAEAWVNEQGIEEAMRKLRQTDSPTAMHYAAGIDLVGRLQTAGRLDDAAELIEGMAAKATTQGQAIQALSLLSKLTAEGIQVYAQRLIGKAVTKSPALAKLAGELSRVRAELRAARQKLAERAIVQAKPSRGSKETIQGRIFRTLVANPGSLWGRYKDRAVQSLGAKLLGPQRPRGIPPLEAFMARLTRNLRDQMPAGPARAAAQRMDEAALLGEAVNNFEKYREVWEEAQAYVQDLFKDHPEALQSLDDYFGEILRRPFSQKSVERTVRQVMQEMNIAMLEVLKLNQADKAAVRKSLTEVIVNRAKVSAADARMIADAAAEEFGRQQQAARDALLRQMTATRTTAAPKSKLEALIALNNAGALDDMRFFAALAKTFGLPAWTSELSAKVQRLQREYEVAKDGQVKLAKAAEMFDAVHSMIPSDVWARVKGVQNIALLLNPKTIIRNIGGNVVLFGADVPADALSRWVIDPLVGIVTGKRTRRSVDVGARVAGLAQPAIDWWHGYQFARSQGATRAASISEGVKTLLTLARLGSAGKYDLGRINKGQSRIFSSRTGRMLEDTLGLVLGVPDRAFHQAAFRASIMRQMRLAEAQGETMVAPTPEMVDEALMDAARAVYQDENFNSKALAQIAKALNLWTTLGRSEKWGLGSVIIPFTQVPGSMLMRAAEWSPIGFIRSAYEVLRPAMRYEFRQKEFVDAFSRATLGTGIAYLGFYLFKLGIITALADEDDDLEAMRQASGLGKFRVNVSALKRAMLTGNWWTPQSPQDGDVSVNYDWVQPHAIPLAMGAAAAQQQRQAGIEQARGKIEALDARLATLLAGGKAAVQTIEAQPLLLGLGRFARGAGDQGPITGTGMNVFNVPAMFVPTFVSQVNQFMDNQLRETRAGGPAEQVASRVLARIPGMSAKYPPRYDVYGEALQRYTYGGNSFFNVMINPAFAQQVKHTRELREMEAIYAATGERGILPKRAPVKIRIANQTAELTNEQISQYQKTAGELTLTVYGRLAAAPRYAAAPPGLKAGALADLMREVHKITVLKVLAGNPDVVQQIREQNQAAAAAKREAMQPQGP